MEAPFSLLAKELLYDERFAKGILDSLSETEIKKVKKCRCKKCSCKK